MKIQVHIDIDENGVGILKTTHFDIIRNHFSWANEARRFAPKYAQKNIPKSEYLITKDGKFPIGIINEIWDFVKKIDSNLSAEQFTVTSRARYHYEPSFLLPEKYELFNFDGWEYRTIQEDALKRVFKRGRGIVRVGTGGGKGLIMASIIKTLLSYNGGQRIAILVPTHLIHKTHKEFIDDYGFTEDEVSMWASKVEPNLQTPVVIFGPNFAVSRKEEFEEHIANRNVMLIDECHIVKAESKITELIKKVKTNNIIGFTGTIPPATKDKWSVLGNIGKVLCDVSSKKLKELNYKANSQVLAIQFTGCKYVPETHYTNDQNIEVKYKDREMYENEMLYLLSSPQRTECIKKWIMRVCKGNTLIPIDRDFHEDLLREAFEDCGRKVVFINGATPEEDRTKAYKDIDNEEDTLLFVKTSIMKEGISINKLDDIVLFFGQKSFIRILQLLGRIERLGSKKIPTLYDFYDETKFSARHFEKRKAIYEADGIPVALKKLALDY